MIRKILIACISLGVLFTASSCNGTKTENMSEKVIAVEVDSNSLSAAETIKDSVKEIRTISTEEGAVSLVESKDADFVVLDEFQSALYIDNKRKIEAVKVLDFTMDYCAYFHGNSELLNRFNNEIIALQQEGITEEIKASYKNNKPFYPELEELSQNAPLLSVATDVVGYPYTDLTDENTITGIDIDILTIVANRMGYELELIVTTTDEGFKLLQNDEVDMVISGLVYEEARDYTYDPSVAYLTVEYYLHTRG